MLSLPGYSIGKLVGQGGVSQVFEAWHQEQQRKLALKIMLEQFKKDTMMRTRLLREAQVIGNLQHRNLVRIYSFGVLDERFYSLMEFLDQGSLADYRRWGPRQLLKIMIQVCDGLAFIHGRSIVHRDLKPSNILFGADGIPRLVDFGISLFGAEDLTRLTQTNLVMGTLCYMSPEQQSQPKNVDARSDIYSLGAILYEIYTGHKPLGRFADPAKLLPGFPADLERVVLRCLETNPAARYQDIRQVRDRLMLLWEEGLFSEGVQNHQGGFDERLGYWLQQWREGSSRQRFEAREQLLAQVRAEDVDRLVELYTTSGEQERLVLIPMLARTGAPPAISCLVQALNHPLLAREAAPGLAQLGASAQALDPLIRLLKSKASHADCALLPLARLGGSSAAKHILPFLASRDSTDRSAALQALELLGVERFAKEIRQAHQAETDPGLKARLARLVRP